MDAEMDRLTLNLQRAVEEATEDETLNARGYLVPTSQAWDSIKDALKAVHEYAASIAWEAGS